MKKNSAEQERRDHLFTDVLYTITFHLKSGVSFSILAPHDYTDLQHNFARFMNGESDAPKFYSKIIYEEDSERVKQVVQVPFSEIAAIEYKHAG